MENWKFALKSILAHKMRSLLTMLGIIIGVAAVVVIVALGTGMSKSIEKALAGDQNNVEVYFMPYTESDESSSMGFFGSIGGGEMSMEEEPDLTDAMLQGLLEIDGYNEVSRLLAERNFLHSNIKLREEVQIRTENNTRA